MRTIKNLFNILFYAARAKIMPLWIKLRMWSTPAFFKSKVLVKVREFFVKLLDVRPRNRRDYYPVFRWLVSKRLAFALVITLGMAAAFYISMILPEGFWKGRETAAGSVQTYKYRSLPLKFHSGSVRILAKDGYVAYDGEVDKGAAVGKGTLYAADGGIVYEGQFADSMYNGDGTLYYSSGTPRYIGSFVDNEFHGNGTYYRANGTMEYQGAYIYGARTGAGILYNSVGDQVFQGNFLNGGIVYPDFLSRSTADIASLYSGKTEVYQSDAEYCVAMPEIDALYSVKDGSNTLENEWTVDRIYVLRDEIPLEQGICSTVRQLQAELGTPLYFGTACVNLPEAVAWNRLAQEQPDEIAPVRISVEAGLENVFAVSGYDRDHQLYLYTYEKEGMLYTFYFTGAGESNFVMYAIEKA